MAKRKSAGRKPKEASGPNMDVGESKKRIRDYEDVAGSDDEFHLQRDKVLLGEEPEAKRRRKWQEQEDFLEPSDEEVLGHSDDDDGLEEDEEEGEDAPVAVAPKRRRRDADSDQGEDALDGDEDDEFDWGTSKADLYGVDEIETEEQALEEEQEALRLQKKQLQAMSAADYGFDEDEWAEAGPAQGGEEDEEAVVTERLPELQVTDDMSDAERLKLLKTRYPEFEPLSKEIISMQDAHADLVEVADVAGASPNAITKLRAASAYLGALTMYFALLSSTASQKEPGVIAMSATRLRDHPVMASIVQCRNLWQRAKDLPLRTADDAEDDSEDEVGSVGDEVEVSDVPEVAPKRSRAQRHADAAQAAVDARRAERLAKTEAGLADLDNLVAPTASRKKSRSAADALATGPDSDVGEEVPLTAREAAEKAKRKKSLRFYTSQIAQKANKRGASGRNAGGDEDVPYRERLKDKQARLNAEAENRGKRRADVGAELGGESDEEDARQAHQIRAEAQDDDYYDMVAARTAKKKSDKAAFTEAQRQAALTGGRVVEEETVGSDGKRKISYAIEKNKGLTPHRKKDVRNPRVKKRKKYEEKKKKLASMKPVYKGGEGRGGYGGELTGIKKGLVKSTKL